MKRPSALVPVVAGFGIMLLLLLAVTAIGVTHIRDLGNQLSAIVSERSQKAEYAATMRALHEARYQSLVLASSQDDAFQRDEEVMRFSHMALDFIRVRDQFLALPLDDGERRLWTRIRQDLRRVEASAGETIDLLQTGRLTAARRQIDQDLLPHQRDMMREWSRLVDLQHAKNQRALAEARAAGTRARNLALTLSAAGVLVGIVIAVSVVRLSRRLENDLFEEKERAQITLGAIGDAVVRFNGAGGVCYLNPAAERLLGLRADEHAGAPLAQVLHLRAASGHADLTAALVAEVLQGGGAVLPIQAQLRSSRGGECTVAGQASPIHTPAGEIMGGVLVLREAEATLGTTHASA